MSAGTGGRILVTGGAGYIGSHTAVELLGAGHEVTLYDNLSNSSIDVVQRIGQIAGTRPEFVHGDVRDKAQLAAVLRGKSYDAVIHFAALKSVAESVAEPLRYYDHNVGGSIALLQAMAQAGCHRLVYSSSATVYGDPENLPLHEQSRVRPVNPYGMTKHLVEQMLVDLAARSSAWSIAILRYFNPAGAHPSALIGESPSGVPNNLLPYIGQVAAGQRPHLQVFGNDYPTRDGTGVRDYIHVCDLARGHFCALEWAKTHRGADVFNLGTGRGYSVMEILRAYEQACERTIPYVLAPRRAGDVAACHADASKAQRVLGWRARLNLDDMCRDAWRWQVRDPRLLASPHENLPRP